MNDLMNKISPHLPPSWDKYSSDPYHQEIVCRYSSEFQKINDLLLNTSSSLDKLYRVENPFAYGQFIIREQFLINKNPTTQYYRARRFLVLNKSKVEAAIKYNLDHRRLDMSSAPHLTRIVPSYISSYEVLLIVKVVTSDVDALNFMPKHNADCYIEYIAHIN